MKLADMRNKTPAELQKQVVKLSTEIATIAREGRDPKKPDVYVMKKLKKEIARLKTVIREFELDAEQGEAA